jgi:hypothetical protein
MTQSGLLRVRLYSAKLPHESLSSSVKLLTPPQTKFININLFGLRPKGRPMASGNAYLLVSSMSSKVTREQYVERSKERARLLLRVGQIREAVASMMMDMWKHPNCGVPSEINAIGISAAAVGNAAVARAYIEGFN